MGATSERAVSATAPVRWPVRTVNQSIARVPGAVACSVCPSVRYRSATARVRASSSISGACRRLPGLYRIVHWSRQSGHFSVAFARPDTPLCWDQAQSIISRPWRTARAAALFEFSATIVFRIPCRSVAVTSLTGRRAIRSKALWRRYEAYAGKYPGSRSDRFSSRKRSTRSRHSQGPCRRRSSSDCRSTSTGQAASAAVSWSPPVVTIACA